MFLSPRQKRLAHLLTKSCAYHSPPLCTCIVHVVLYINCLTSRLNQIKFLMDHDCANCQHVSTLIHFLLEVKFFIWGETQDLSYVYGAAEYFGSDIGYRFPIHVHCKYVCTVILKFG